MSRKPVLEVSLRENLKELSVELLVIVSAFFGAYMSARRGGWWWLLGIPAGLLGVFVILVNIPFFIGRAFRTKCPRCHGRAEFWKYQRKIKCYSDCGEFYLDDLVPRQ